MSLEERVGQVIFPAVRDRSEISPATLRALGDLHVGGILLTGGHLSACGPLIEWMRAESSRGLIVTADVERGIGERIDGATEFPSNHAIGSTGDPRLARRLGEIAAREARYAGIDLLLAPVLDVQGPVESPIVGTRSFGDDPEVVADFGSACIEGVRSSGGACCAKHFPGHGAALQDSHLTLPVIEGDLDALLPFERAIRAGVDAVMVGHIRVVSIDGPVGPPASLSPGVIGSLLRERMGFGGLILTDAILMGGITRVLTEEEAAVRALQAGADVILCPTDPGPIHRCLLDAVRDGSLPRDRLDDAVGRIIEFKERRESPGIAIPDPEEIDGHRQEAIRMAEASVRREGGPIPEDEPVLVIHVPDRADPWAGGPFLDEVVRRAPTTVHHLLPGWGKAEWDRVASLSRGARTVIWTAVGRPAAWRPIGRGVDPETPLPGHRTVTVALGSPTLRDRSPRTDRFICAFSDAEVSQRAAARALFGEMSS
jgi:beta-glucosidase-like glycosyl hydrolase